MEHQEIKVGSKFYQMDYYEQMSNIAGEVNRELRMQQRYGKEKTSKSSAATAIKYLNIMLEDPKNEYRRDVIRRDIAVLEDYFFGNNLQNHDEAAIRKYYKYFEDDYTIEFLRQELDAAMLLAARFYQGKRDADRNNRILHPIKVMLQMKEPEEKIVALLHDILNETACTVEELRTAGISNYAIDTIVLLSGEEGESYTQYIERIKASEIARKVKIADLREHLKEECLEA